MLAADYELDDLGAGDLDDTAEVDWVQVYEGASRARHGRRTAGSAT